MMHRILLGVACVFLTGSVAMRQDAVKVDPQHYKVDGDNAHVRVLRIHYGPHEKSDVADVIASFRFSHILATKRGFLGASLSCFTYAFCPAVALAATRIASPESIATTFLTNREPGADKLGS